MRTLLTTLCLAGAVVAQIAPADSAAPAHKMHGRGAGLAQLNLTDQQTSQKQGIMQAQRQQAQAIQADTALTPEQKQDKLKQLRASTHQQVQGLLTPEQQQQWQQFRGQHKGMGRRMGALSRLNLTEEQRAKIQPILQSTHEQAKALRNDTTLTPEQKKAKMRELHQGAMSQVQGLLTPEQQQQMQQWRRRRGRQQGPPSGPPSGL